MILLDTHIWLRWLEPGDSPLPQRLVDIIETTESTAVASVSVWEAAYLAQANRVELAAPWEEWLTMATTRANIEVVALSGAIAARAAHLPLHHRDPADRFIIATALELGASLVSLDARFPLYQDLAGRLVQ